MVREPGEERREQFRIANLPPYSLGEIAARVMEARSRGCDVVDLSQVNPPMPPPQVAVDKLVQMSLLPHHHRYSSSQGLRKLREAGVSLYQERLGVELDVESEIVVTLGTKEGLGHLLLAVLNPGDNVLIPTPAYPVHCAGVFIAHAGFIGVSLAPTEGSLPVVLTGESDWWFERLSEVIQASWPRPKMVLVSFPHNPTTSTVELSFFERLVSVARDHGMWIVHDFAYADLCYGGYRAPSLLQAAGAKELGVEFYSLSKSYGLAGWRVGFCVGNPALVQALKKIKSYLDFGLFQPLQIGATAALRSNYPAELVGEYESRRDVLVSGLRELQWEVESPRATVLVWAKLPEQIAEGSREWSARLLESQNVAVCSGSGFDLHADRYVRFALVEPENRLRRALSAIEKVSR